MEHRKYISQSTRLEVYNKYHGHCAYCGKHIDMKDMQVDHILPVYRGGQDIAANYNPSCRMCNFYKSTHTVDEFKHQLTKILGRLEKVFIFRVAKRYGLISETGVKVEFYFEQIDKTKVNELISSVSDADNLTSGKADLKLDS